MRELGGKVAVVTGGASGIGRALADSFAAAGMRVALADVEQAPLAAAVDELRQAGAEAIGVRTDVRDPADVEGLAERTIAEFGAVHVLCNNAGVETGGAFEQIPLPAWRWVLDVNLWGVLNGCRTFLPLLREQGEGHIVNTGSMASFAVPAPTLHPYVVSKYAVLALSESLESELRANGEPIGVSLLAPGPVRTRMPEAERNRPPEVPATAADPVRREVLESLGRLAEANGLEAAEVAELVLAAIRERRFFVLTHPEPAFAAVRQRLRALETGEWAPPLVDQLEA